jgi:putative flippase GtrA
MLHDPKIKHLLSIRFVRYLLAAGTATAIDIGVYTALYAWFRHLTDWSMPASPHASAFIGGFSAGLLTNFWISKKLVFKESVLATRTQLIRFTTVALLVLAANWYFMELLRKISSSYLESLPIDFKAFIIRTTAAAVVAILSFVSHKAFSFRVR